MTHWSEAGYVPPLIHIRCPTCSGAAEFFRAIRQQVKTRKAWEEGRKSVAFMCSEWTKSGGDSYATLWYYPELDLHSGRGCVRDRQRYRGDSKLGTILCPSCHLKKKGELRWPKQAFYQCDIRGRKLWAWNRAHTVALRDFVITPHRMNPAYERPIQSFLKTVPTHFLSARCRKLVLKRLERLLRDNK